ncbi:CoA pyrophosphatase [Devosia sp.]|uniref:CoA pyrophosphatase n=1 Tax=Devosia sp. TaxID=1871048 RepID=UPI0032643EDE
MDDAIVDRIAARLLQQAPGLDTHGELIPDWAPTLPFERPPVLAAVLIGLVMRPEGHTILYTERSRELRAHSGQVAFPGGKIDPSDIDAADAALREAGEEVGLRRHEARVLGYLPTYYTGTNYLITPVVAEIIPTHPFVPNPSEVYSLFEVPLARVLDLGSYGQYRIKRNGEEHRTWQIDHDGHVIWGITANLTRRFRDIALGEGGQ